MRYVLDSNVGIKWVLPEADSPQAIALRDDFRQGLHELIAPDVFPVEVAHALARAERRGIIASPEAIVRFRQIAVVLPLLHFHLPLLPRALEIASQAKIGVYDCLYVALAEQEGCELITADKRLVNALQTAFPFILELSSAP